MRFNSKSGFDPEHVFISGSGDGPVLGNGIARSATDLVGDTIVPLSGREEGLLVSLTPHDDPKSFGHYVRFFDAHACKDPDRPYVFAAKRELIDDLNARLTLVRSFTGRVLGGVFTTLQTDGRAYLGGLLDGNDSRGIGLSTRLVAWARVDRAGQDGRQREVVADVRIIDGVPNPRSARALVANGFRYVSQYRLNAASLGYRARFWSEDEVDVAIFVVRTSDHGEEN